MGDPPGGVVVEEFDEEIDNFELTEINTLGDTILEPISNLGLE